MIVMGPEQYSRQHVIDLLRQAGWSDLADEASRTLFPIRLMSRSLRHGASSMAFLPKI